MDIYISKSEPAAAKLLLDGIVTDQQTGDYIFFSNKGARVGIERKEIMDFISSMRNGRLDDQMVRLAESFDYAFLIQEGELKRSTQGWAVTRLGVLDGDGVPKVRFDELRGYDISVMIRLGIKVMHTDNFEDTIHLIESLYNWFHKEEHHPFLKKEFIGFEGDRRTNILMQFEGIGPALAKDILDAYDGKLIDVFNSSPEQLRKVKGMGKKRVERLMKELGR